MMKNVVMIAYSFPPEGHAGVYRPLRFVRYLPAMGWLPSVISLAPYLYDRYDPGLLAMVPSGIEVIRVRACDPWQAIQARRARRFQEQAENGVANTEVPIRRVHQKTVRSLMRELVRIAEAWCYHPDMAMCWIRPAEDATVKLSARKQPKVIWATAMPWSSFLVAQRASQRMGVPYVLDFRDSWTVTENEIESRRPLWAKRRDRHTLHRLFQGAQAVIFRYATEVECYWRAYQGALDVSRIHIIPNGYEGGIDEFAVSKGDKFTILYTGTLASYRYDTLLQSLCEIRKSDPAWAKQLRLLFVGEGTETLEHETRTLGLTDLVATVSPTSYAEINRLQREAHALLVLGRPPTMKGYELFASAKLFGYLKAGRPIIGILPPDEARKILHHVGVSTVAEADSPAQIVDVLRRLLNAWSAGTLSALVPNRTACAAYSAERQTAALVRALEGMAATEPFVPGSVDIPPSLRREIDHKDWLNGWSS
jgi:hypothetical protein